MFNRIGEEFRLQPCDVFWKAETLDEIPTAEAMLQAQRHVDASVSHAGTIVEVGLHAGHPTKPGVDSQPDTQIDTKTGIKTGKVPSGALFFLAKPMT